MQQLINNNTCSINYDMKIKEGTIFNPQVHDIITDNNYCNQYYMNLIVSGCKLDSITFKNCHFDNVQFQSSNIANCNFINCKFENCNFEFSAISKCNFNFSFFCKSKTQRTIYNFALFNSCHLDSYSLENMYSDDLEFKNTMILNDSLINSLYYY
jgi:uncharacterized protein YjbI with pentapeptide repeats